jgi:hypothetical protein
MKKQKSELLQIPGIGPAMTQDLNLLGYNTIADLKNADPQAMYDTLCEKTGAQHDPCVLYTFRCAVYYASHTKHDPRLLKWWNWKDRE